MIDRYANLLETLRQHFRDAEIRALDVLKAAQGNQTLMVALIACVPRPTVHRVGKLFARLRGKGYGDHMLEGSIDAHTKSWIYTVIPWVLPKISPIAAAEADLAAALEIMPLEQMSAAEAAKVMAGNGTRILQRVQTEKDEEIQRAQRALDRAKIAQDPEAAELIKRNREQRKALHRHGGIHDSDYQNWNLPAPVAAVPKAVQAPLPPPPTPIEKRRGEGDPTVKKVLVQRPGGRCEWVEPSEAGSAFRPYDTVTETASHLTPSPWGQRTASLNSVRSDSTNIFGWTAP